MKWKEFLKPDWRKIIIPILSILAFAFYTNDSNSFRFYIWIIFGAPLLTPLSILIAPFLTVFPFFLSWEIINTIFWYLISCWLFEKPNKERFIAIVLMLIFNTFINVLLYFL